MTRARWRALSLSVRHGLLLRYGARWWQMHYGRGTTMRRLIWWPRFGHVGVRVAGDWWVNLAWRVLLAVAVVCSFPSVLRAQPHPCDTTPPSVTSVQAGQSFTLGACTPDPGSGVNALTSVRLYRNGALDASAVVTVGATANAAGLRFVSHVRSEPAVGSVSYEFEPVNAQGTGIRLPFAPVSVTPAPTLPSALSRPRITVP